MDSSRSSHAGSLSHRRGEIENSGNTEAGWHSLGSKPRRESWPVMISALIALTLMFLLSFFNRFAGLRSGAGEYAGGMTLLSGIMPYRDYFTAGPPLNVVKSALILKAFGSALIVSRAAGVLERLLIALVLLRWLVQLFRPWHALVASVVTIVVSTGDPTDPIASYNHDAILFGMIAGLAASLMLEGGSKRRTIILAMVSGASAMLSLLSKQTVGLGVVVCLAMAGTILVAKLDGMRRAGVWCAGYAAGCVVPLAATALWLWKIHVLHACIQMLFVTGPAAKAGHASDFLVRELVVAWLNWKRLLAALIGLALGWQAVRRGLQAKDTRVPTRWAQATWVAAGAAIIATAEALAYSKLPVQRNFSKCAVYYVLVGLTLWLASQMVWLFRAGVSRRAAQAILFGAVAWSIAVMLSLSWPAFEPMTLPGLGLLLAATLDGVRDRFRWFPLLIMAALVFLQVREKLDGPFGFGHQNEAAVRLADKPSMEPQLRGMRLPSAMVTFLDDTSTLVATQTRPGDTIFTYPEMGLLYPLTGRMPPTRAGSHNIDVINDAFARDEAGRLTRARPAVIVYGRLSEHDLEEEEKTWRRGRRSGQRDIIAALDGLVQGYRLTGTYVIAPGDPPIEVYVRH